MEKTIYYKFFPELQLGIEIFFGNIYYSDLIELKEKEIKDSNFNPNFNGLVILNNAYFNISSDEIEAFKEYLKKQKQLLGKRKTAILTQTPNQVVNAMLYSIPDKDIPMKFKVFSTIKASINWIGIQPEYEEKINDIIKNATQHT